MIYRCAVCGCRIAEQDKGRCKKHPRTFQRSRKNTGSQYGRRWKKIRDYMIDMYPVCLCCSDSFAVEVDHIKPLNDNSDFDDVLNPENLAPLCKRCHTWKTHNIDPVFDTKNPVVRRYIETIEKAKKETV